MTEINYKLVYELRDKEQAIFAAERKVEEAKAKVQEALGIYKDACYKASGAPKDSLKFSNTLCVAKGIASHVYWIKNNNPYGSSKNKCIFCGCDNVDSLY